MTTYEWIALAGGLILYASIAIVFWKMTSH